VITHPTTFVVGAGASFDFGFPLGEGLTKQISNSLILNNTARSDAAELMRTALSILPRRSDVRIATVELYRQAPILRAGLGTASSIDAFLDSRHDDGAIELLGKMAIGACLITAERACSPLRPRRPGEPIDISASESSWIARLFRTVLAPGVKKSHLERIFENVSFIVFNYDRCIEHYLTHALASHFTIDLDTAASVVRDRLNIVHPYGSLGPLHGVNDAIDFGHDYRSDTPHAADGIYAISQRILTFTESQKANAAEAKAMVENALRLVFLGFGFGDQNMELLRPRNTTIQDIRGTVKGLSRSNQREVAAQIHALTGQQVDGDDLVDCDCASLISSEQMFLTRR